MIRFSCTCGTELRLPLVLAGETGRCPRCQRSLQAPVPAGHVPWHQVQRGEDAEEGVRIIQVARNPMANRTRAVLAFSCPSCQEPLRIKVAHAGKAGKCGHCAATFTIPERPAPAAPGSSRLKPQEKAWGEGGRATDPVAPPSPARERRATRGSQRKAAQEKTAQKTAQGERDSGEAKASAPAASAEPPGSPAPPPASPRAGRRAAPPPVAAKRRAAAPQGRAAFSVVRVACACGRQVRAPLTRLRAGEARCPSCDEVLHE